MREESGPEISGWVDPTRDDAVVASLSEGIGGPVGTRASGHPWWTPVRVLLALAALAMALGMVTKSACADTDWQDMDVRTSAMCYSDMPYLYIGRGFAERHWPYTGDEAVRSEFEVMEYPTGISYWAWGTSYVTWWLSGSPADDEPGRDLPAEGTLFVAVNAVGFTLIVLISTWLLAGVNRVRLGSGRILRRPWDAAGFAIAPALVLTGLVNWDLLAIGFVAGALWAWSRDRPILTGVMIGLGTAAKLYPLFLLGGVLVLCLRGRRWAPLGYASAATVLSWVVAQVPAWVTGPDQWQVFWHFNSERTADLGSLWLVAQQMTDATITADTINLWSWAFFLGWCLAVALVGLLAPRPPRFAQLGFLIIAGFLLVNKVYSPQYVLWLLPLAALARPRWRDLLIWQAGELIYFASVWWYLDGRLDPGAGDDPVAYWVTTVVRVLAQLYLVAVVTRDVLRPEHDPVPRDPDDRGGPGPQEPDPEPQTTSTRSNQVAV
ncbi:glycosyltransferase family 87 protein [Nocardioides campestrisoli]|uniref:glycosyltransferase family 87 protein n=1 Tax=Nocardioides campestrisoli TaxID=2736757 RepID=UPI0015E7A728|nr:glycosyltransferase 87 family protein [Nocardioides campestrisoli]